MADLVRHAVGVDLVEIALLQALGEPVPDALVTPAFQQPLAIRFLTAEPGPLATGIVTRIGALDPVLAAEGVVQADTYLRVGETIRPVRGRRRSSGLRDRDRRHVGRGARTCRRSGGATPGRDRGRMTSERPDGDELPVEHDVPEGCRFELEHYGEILDAARTGGYRFVGFVRGAVAGSDSSSVTTSTSRSTPRCGWRSSRQRERARDVLPDDRVGLLQPRLRGGAGRDRPTARPRSRGRPARRPSERRRSTSASASTRCSPGTTPTRSS